MNVLFIGPLPEPVTGQSLACQVFVDELVKHHRVEIVNLSKTGFKQGVNSFERVPEVLGIVASVWRKQKACDVMYLTISESIAGNLKDLLIYLACFSRLSRMIVHLHGGAGMRGIMLGGNQLLRRANAFFVKRLGAVVVLGQRHVEIFAGCIDRRRIHIVPNFAQDYLFADAVGIRGKFEQVRPLRILFLSNLLPGKGHVELVQALLAMNETVRATVQIDFAGGFESEQQKLDFMRSIEGFPQVRYHGSVHGEQKRLLFQAAHVFCLPTYYASEGQPISILEAYAAGCAVITTDHSGIFDVFADQVNGYAVEKKSFTALKSAIEKAIAMPQQLCAMAITNFEAASALYRTSRHTRDLVGIVAAVQEQVS